MLFRYYIDKANSIGSLKKYIHILLLVFSVLAFSSCSTKKNTSMSRFYQSFTTRYNVYFNGDEHYKETIKSLEKNYEDDYSQLVFVHPVDAYNHPKSPQAQGNFDRSIEKAQKAIQLHSIKKKPKKKSGKSRDPKYKEWMSREEYNPFLHNAWLMMGRSQYNNGDFLGAASTFNYISKHFPWLPETTTEAQLWLARSYTSLDWLFDAENILIHIKQERLTNNTLKGLYYLIYTDYCLKGNNYDGAIPYLENAVEFAKGPQKTRLRFLLGQLYSRAGKKKEAYNIFKTIGGTSSAPYRTQFNARIKQSEVYDGANIESEVKALKRMTRYDRNKEYLDQIYYAIGNLYLSRNDTTNAIANYIIAGEKSTRNGIDKAINQLTLGRLYFEQSRYDLAQPCYSEAVPQLPDDYPDYETLKKRSDVLDELAVYAQNVALQDSLLILSEKSPEEQRAVIDKIIEELKKKEEEEEENARREAYLADQAAQGNGLQQGNTPQSFNLNTDDSWYFYNTATKNAGKTAFQKKWGSRKLEDDWRRRNKASFSMNEFEATTYEDNENQELGDSLLQADSNLSEEELNELKEKEKRAEDPHYPEYYFKQIPKTNEEKTIAHDVIQEGLFNMGVILKDKLEDFSAAFTQFDKLLIKYPDNIYRLDTYYNLYLMFMRQDNKYLASKYKDLIIDQFPESPYGIAMKDPMYLENLKTMNVRQEQMYEKAYAAYLSNDNATVHESYQEMMRQFPLSKIMPKFMFLHALAYITEGDPENFNTTLKELLERYPETDITPLASSYLKQMAQGRELETSTSNMRGMLWDIRLSNDSVTDNSASAGQAQFTLNNNEPHLLVLTYPIDSVSANQLLYEIARHNFTSFAVKDFDLQQMNFGRLGMLIIKGFDNIQEIVHYRNVMQQNESLKLPQQVRPIVISSGNFDILINQGRSFEEYFRFIEEQSLDESQTQMLPTDIFGLPTPQTETPQTAEDAPAADSATEEQPIKEIANEEIIVDNNKNTEIPPTEEKSEERLQPQTVEKEQPTQPSKPAEKPATKKTVTTVTKPATLPIYPTGSEGDDPLIDTP